MIDPEPASLTKAEKRRQQILDAACACVRRAGFHGASMAEIAQAASLSVGQIYRYFESKDAIVAAIVDQDLAELRDKFAEIERSGGSMVEAAIAHCSEAMDRNYDPDRAALALEVMAEAARNPRVAAIVRKADAAWHEVLRKLLDEACPSDCDEAEKAARSEMLSLIFDGMLMRAVNNPDADRTELGKLLQAVLGLILCRKSSDAATP